LSKEIDALIEDNLENFKDQISIESPENEVIIRLMGESTFDSGKTEIRPRLKPLLLKVAAILKASAGDISIAGHTDNVPIRKGPFKTNLRLSAARASAVAEFFIANARIDPKRISTMGFGQYRPIGSNDTAEGRQKNRRVEIILGNIPHREHFSPAIGK
jgi:chemotaxis protein MotB